jgi:hypothetical protein
LIGDSKLLFSEEEASESAATEGWQMPKTDPEIVKNSIKK